MQDVGRYYPIVISNLNRVYLIVKLIELRAVFFLARAYILGPERW